MNSRLFSAVLSLTMWLFLIVNMFSCKTADDMFQMTDYIFENKTDSKAYFVKVDTIVGSHLSGRFYCIGDESVMQSEPFSMSCNGRRCRLVLSDSSFYVLKIERFKDDEIIGSYMHLSKKNNFIIYPYKTVEYQSVDIDVYDNAGRYRNEVFEVERIQDVNYAKAKGFWTSIPDDTVDVSGIVKTGIMSSMNKRELDLDMDIYIPKNDTLEKRPLMMFIHGGAFFIGDKATLPYQRWCAHFASLGYVCVSINYRMGFRTSPNAIQRTAYQATQDAHAAMRYLLSKKDVYRIDPDLLFVCGASAGSITALNLAYMRNENRPETSYSYFLTGDLGDIEASGNDCDETFEIKAIANMWGAVYDLEMLRNSNASIISFHGDEDVIMPYKSGYPFEAMGVFKKVFFDEMYGSYCIDQKAKELGIRSKLYTFEGEGHALHLDEDRNLNENFYIIQNEIADFFYQEINPYPAYITQDENDIQLFTIDTTDVASADWDVDGGLVINRSKGVIRVSWFDDARCHKLKVSGYYKNGVGFEDVFVIKEDIVNESYSY